MTRDPLLEQVRGSFENKIDQDEFEICAVDLLSAIYSKLVPVVGGTDGGFDGAVSAPDGVYPLIATTAKDVIGNVRRNAKTYLESNPQGPRRVVVACTECLTQPRRKNIMKLQQELEIKIDQVYDGHWLIERLYRNPNWRKRLLRLSGDTPALSALPKHSRFDEIASVLIGRGAQQERLRGLKEDLLIVGQPG
ncbi:MAG: hypothetical protein KDA20_12520, partial [Phycisphaerales bacterium]|nr:hypothetical protein [Phycisphaerales bacterium]